MAFEYIICGAGIAGLYCALNLIEKNPRPLLKSIFRQWLPIPPSVLDVVVSHLPNPIKGAANKIDIIFPPYRISQQDYPLISNLKNTII